MKTLETERLWLRPFATDDLDDFFSYAKNPNVGPHAGWKPHESLEESGEILKTFMAGEEVRAIVDKVSGRVIGSIGIEKDGLRYKIPGCRMLGYVLDEAYWGKGIMQEAVRCIIEYVFEVEKLQLLAVRHYPDNIRSRRVIEKCGFTYEGVLRQATKIYNGAIKDLCLYSMTRREYLVHKAAIRGLTLRLPEEICEAEHIVYRNAWDQKGEGLTPYAARLNDLAYTDWLSQNVRARETAAEGYVCATTYALVDHSGSILGMTDFRHTLNERLSYVGGHIGYGVHPKYRGNGYAEIMLALTLEKARERGLNRVLLTCLTANRASANVIKANGGVLECEVERDGEVFSRYWITV